MICRNVLLSISFVARRDDFIVGQVGNLRPIVNRPAGSAHSAEGSPSPLATCRYVGQAILPAAAFQAALGPGTKSRVRLAPADIAALRKRGQGLRRLQQPPAGGLTIRRRLPTCPHKENLA